MPYAKDHAMLTKHLEDMVLIESPFQETTRDGLNLASVLLAITRNQFVIVMRKRLSLSTGIYYNRIESQHDLKDVELSIFKQTRRQVLKACFHNETVKYFELGLCKKRKIFWKIWCNLVRELKSEDVKWPFQTLKESSIYLEQDTDTTPSKLTTDNLPDEVIVNSNIRKSRNRWTDKYLYLGSKREKEDYDRPVPVELESPDNVKLFYFESKFVGCWDQTEHWVQCGDSALDSARVESHVSTYTGQPTSKVTYTSIITAWK